jgi:hypothetical protein
MRYVAGELGGVSREADNVITLWQKPYCLYAVVMSCSSFLLFFIVSLYSLSSLILYFVSYFIFIFFSDLLLFKVY